MLPVDRRHRWARRRSLCIRELADEPMVFREDGSNAQRSLQAAADAAGVTLTRALTCGSREGVVASVVAGLGVGSIPENQVIAHADLRVLRIEDAQVYVDSWLACLAEQAESRIVRAFMEVAERVLVRSGVTPARPRFGYSYARHRATVCGVRGGRMPPFVALHRRAPMGARPL